MHIRSVTLVLIAGAPLFLAASAFAQSAPPSPASSSQREGSALWSRLRGFVGLDARIGDVGGDFATFVGAEGAIVLPQRTYVGLRGAAPSYANGRRPTPCSPR